MATEDAATTEMDEARDEGEAVEARAHARAKMVMVEVERRAQERGHFWFKSFRSTDAQVPAPDNT